MPWCDLAPPYACAHLVQVSPSLTTVYHRFLHLLAPSSLHLLSFTSSGGSSVPSQLPGLDPPEEVPHPTPPIHPLWEALAAPGCAGARLPAEGLPGPAQQPSQAPQRASGFRERRRLSGQTGHPPARCPVASGPFSQLIPAGQESALHLQPFLPRATLVQTGAVSFEGRCWGTPPSGGLFQDPATLPALAGF